MSSIHQEIASQPETWARALELRGEAGRLLAAPGERLLLLGCGTSAFVAASIAALREDAGLGETDAAYASEPPLRRRYDRAVAISRSGTTTEILEALGRLPGSIRKIGITAVTGSPMDGLIDERLVLDFADEAAVVQTRFPTTTLALARAALGLPVAGLVEAARAAVSGPLPAEPAGWDHFVFLGSGWTRGLADEAALKLRETAQAWSESYPAMDYRHGPITVAGHRTLVWMLGPPPAGLRGDIASTGARVVHDHDSLDPLAQLILIQRFAVGLAALRGLDPDQPRHLTRSVVLDGHRTLER